MLNLHTYPYPEITGLQAMTSNLKTDPTLLQEAKDRGFYGGFDGIRGQYNNLYQDIMSRQGAITFKPNIPNEIQAKIWKYCNAFMRSTYGTPAERQAICAMLMSEILEPEFKPKPTTKKQLTKLEAQTLLFQTMLQMSNRELESVLYYLDNGKTTSGFEVTDK